MAKVSKDFIDSYGNAPLSPWMSGEQGKRTAAVVQGASRKEENKIGLSEDQTWSEPDVIAPSRSMNTVVFQAKNGGNTVVVNDEGSDGTGYIMITHNTGSVVQIDQNGNVLIKSFGDTHNTSEGVQHQRSEGNYNLNVGDDWNVRVEGGSNNVYVQGDVNIQCENFNVEARGKATINAAEALELRGAKVSIEASATDIDMASFSNIRASALTGGISMGSTLGMSLNSLTSLNLGSGVATNIGSLVLVNTKVGGAYIVQAGGLVDIKATGLAYFDGLLVRLGESISPPIPLPAKPDNAEMPKLKTPEARRPATNSQDNINTVMPSPEGISDRAGDDTKQ